MKRKKTIGHPERYASGGPRTGGDSWTQVVKEIRRYIRKLIKMELEA